MHPRLEKDLARMPELLEDVRAQAVRLLAEPGERIAALPAYRLLAPVRLNVVCFTPADAPERIGELTQAIIDSGTAFLTPTVYDGVPALRAAFSNWRTTEADVDRVVTALAPR